jgi:hypothetical protein
MCSPAAVATMLNPAPVPVKNFVVDMSRFLFGLPTGELARVWTTGRHGGRHVTFVTGV